MFVTYNGLLDPLGPTQILPYIELLHERWPMHALSYERTERLTHEGVAELERRLDSQGIRWTRLRYHKRPSLLAKSWDLALGARRLRTILRSARVEIVHARGYVPMEIALRAGGNAPILFDIRGLQGEEYVEGGVWSRWDPRLWMLKRSEGRFFGRADAAVVLSRAILPYVTEMFAALGRRPEIEVIPSCVDTERFQYDEAARRTQRSLLGVADDVVVFVYSGSLGTWYMADEMAALVRVFGEATGRETFLLWQVNTGAEIALSASRRAGLRPDRLRVLSAKREEVVGQLSAADVGLALIRPTFSKRASSPTKYGEYLSVGMPVVFSSGVGDSDDLGRADVGVGISTFDADGLARAAVEIERLLRRPREDFRGAAIRLFDLRTVARPAYHRLYERLLSKSEDQPGAGRDRG